MSVPSKVTILIYPSWNAFESERGRINNYCETTGVDCYSSGQTGDIWSLLSSFLCRNTGSGSTVVSTFGSVTQNCFPQIT